MTALHIAVTSRYRGGLTGNGNLAGPHLSAPFAAAAELGGQGVGTDPEELLFAAAAACYLITLATMLDGRGVPVSEIELETRGQVQTEPLRIDRIVHAPRLRLDADATPEARESALAMARRAEQACMITAALRGNVTVTVSPSIA